MITIGYCTRVSDENHGKHLIKTCGLDPKKIQIIEIVNTGDRSLTNCYNEILNKSKYDHVVFCHSDITIETKQWGTKLLRLFDRNPEFGIIGVAGTKNLPSSGRWWDNPKKMYGRVAHTHEGKTWLSTYSDDLAQFIEETVIVDGVFFAIDKRKIKKNFDENVKGFHFYDLTFCFENYLEGVKIGVTTVVRINHKSIGMTNDQWEENRQQFSERFKENLPVDIKRVLRKGEQLKIVLAAINFDDTNMKSKIMFEVAKKLKQKNHEVTVCGNLVGKMPIVAKQSGLIVSRIQEPPNFAIGDGKWKVKTQNGEFPSQPNVLYKIKDKRFDVIHVFDDELIEHMNKLYASTSILNTKTPNGLFVNNDNNPMVKKSVELSNNLDDVKNMDIDNIINLYIESI